MQTLAVIMVSYKTGPALLAAIAAVLSDPDISELILVDNGNSAKARREFFDVIKTEPRVRIAQGHGNIGFGRACNYGACLTRAQHVLFLNPDTEIELGAAGKMRAAASGLSAPWIVGGLLINKAGIEQRGSRRGALTLGSFFTGINRHKTRLPDKAVPIPTISGAALMMSRESFEMTGGFNADYFLHVEDIELCRRVRAMGGTVMIDPNARIVHAGATSQVTHMSIVNHKARSFMRYFWDGAGPVGKIGVIATAPFIIAAIYLRGLLR